MLLWLVGRRLIGRSGSECLCFWNAFLAVNVSEVAGWVDYVSYAAFEFFGFWDGVRFLCRNEGEVLNEVEESTERADWKTDE